MTAHRTTRRSARRLLRDDFEIAPATLALLAVNLSVLVERRDLRRPWPSSAFEIHDRGASMPTTPLPAVPSSREVRRLSDREQPSRIALRPANPSPLEAHTRDRFRVGHGRSRGHENPGIGAFQVFLTMNCARRRELVDVGHPHDVDRSSRLGRAPRFSSESRDYVRSLQLSVAAS